MNLKPIIEQALNPIIPTFPLDYNGNATTYITFFRYLKQPEGASDDNETETGHYYQIDIWRKSTDTSANDIWDLEGQVEAALKAVGFTDFTAQDLYEKDTKTTHIVVRCFYFEEIEEV